MAYAWLASQGYPSMARIRSLAKPSWANDDREQAVSSVGKSPRTSHPRKSLQSERDRSEVSRIPSAIVANAVKHVARGRARAAF